MTISNDTKSPANAEAWLPMTFPINDKSQILSQQIKRWRRDEWSHGFLPNVIEWADINSVKDENGTTYDWNKPLSWPGSGIFYDFPHKNGDFNGCTIDEDGKGVVYYAPESKGPHHTKMWGWGDPHLFDRDWAIENSPLAAGRPKTEYYEPWSSGFNFGFFQTTEFKAGHEYNWEIAIVPIPSGLETQKPLQEKITTVDNYLKDLEATQDLGSIGPVKVTPMEQPTDSFEATATKGPVKVTSINENSDSCKGIFLFFLCSLFFLPFILERKRKFSFSNQGCPDGEEILGDSSSPQWSTARYHALATRAIASEKNRNDNTHQQNDISSAATKFPSSSCEPYFGISYQNKSSSTTTSEVSSPV